MVVLVLIGLEGLGGVGKESDQTEKLHHILCDMVFQGLCLALVCGRD